MPVIKEYTAQVSERGPIRNLQATPEQFGALEGRAIAEAGQAITKAADFVATRMDQENTSDITNKVTKVNADLSVKLQEVIRTTNPGDKKPFEDFEKEVEDSLSRIGEEASTVSAREFYKEASTRIKSQLYQTSMAGQAELAGIKAVNDYTSTLNNLSAAAYADPSSIELQRTLHNGAINNLVNTGQLPAHKALELKQRGEAAVVKSTLKGWASLNPTFAREKLKSGEYDSILGAEGKMQIESEIDQAERAREVEMERRRLQAERELKIKQTQTQNDFLQAILDNKLTDKDIMASNLDPFGSGSKEQFIEMLKKANDPETRLRTDSATFIQLFNRINLPDDDPNKISDENALNEYVGRGLSFNDLNKLRDEIQGKNTIEGQRDNALKTQFLQTAKSQLTKTDELTGIRDPEGDEQYQRFLSVFLEEYRERRAKGESALELLTPGTPKYLGNLIDPLRRSVQQKMRSAVNKTKGRPFDPTAPAYQAPKPPERLKGESLSDYEKRIGGGK